MIESRRVDKLTAGRVDVAIVFREMLGADDAAAYMEANGIPAHVAERVLRGKAKIGTRDGVHHPNTNLHEA